MMTRIEAAFATDPNSRLRDDGDVEAELAKGDVIEAEYRIPFLAHASMEPLNATAWVKPDGTVESTMARARPAGRSTASSRTPPPTSAGSPASSRSGRSSRPGPPPAPSSPWSGRRRG